jgi:cysteinyl-tRNA synthetase
MDYSDEKMEEVKRSKERIMIFFDKVDKLLKEHANEDTLDADSLSKAQSAVNGFQEKFEEVMNDDFNTSSAISVIFEAVKAGNDCLSDKNISLGEKVHTSGAIKNYILRFANILGLSLRPIQMEEGKTGEVERLVAEREEARKKKDYASSDRLRKELEDMGVVVEDTPEGPVWRKK